MGLLCLTNFHYSPTSLSINILNEWLFMFHCILEICKGEKMKEKKHLLIGFINLREIILLEPLNETVEQHP